MAVEVTIICDGCGERIASSRDGLRYAVADAQLNQGAIVSSFHGTATCRSCRAKRAATPDGAALKGAPSVGTQRALPAIPGPDASWPIDQAKR